jgi:hypothetical protein
MFSRIIEDAARLSVSDWFVVFFTAGTMLTLSIVGIIGSYTENKKARDK